MRIPAIVLALLVCARTGLSQDVPSFAASSDVVRVDVLVLDGKGQPVAGLGRGDFELREDGQPQQVDSFEAIDLRTPSAASPAAAKAPGAPAGPRPPRVFLLVFDDIHLDVLTAGRAKEALSQFLDTGVRDGDQVVLATTQTGAATGGRIPEQRAALKQALEGFGGRKPKDDPGARISDSDAYQLHVLRNEEVAKAVTRRYYETGQLAEAVRNLDPDAPKRPAGGEPVEDPLQLKQGFPAVYARAATVYAKARTGAHTALGALERLVDGLAGQPGRKVVVLLSEGFFNDPAEDLYAPVKDAARRANAAFYFLDARGLGGLPGVMSAEMGGRIDDRDVGATLHQEDRDADGSAALALDTGGRVIRVGRLDDALDRVARESEAYYVLGYTPTNGALDGKFRKIQVAVKRPGVEVRARSGYRALPRKALQPGELHPDVRRALDSALPASDLPVRLAAFVLGPGASGATTLLVAEADAGAVAWREVGNAKLGRLDAGFRVQSAQGEAQDQPYVAELALAPDAHRRALSAGLPLRRELELLPGRYRARIAVRDEASGRIGSASQEFEVPSASFRASTPVLGDTVESEGGSTRAVPVARRSFPAGGKLYCGFQVFGAGESAGVSAELDVKRSDGVALASTGPRPLPRAADGALGRVIALSLEGAEPGDYELLLRVKDEASGAVDVQRQGFKVVPGQAAERAAGVPSYRELVKAYQKGDTGAASGLLALGLGAALEGSRAADCAGACKVAAALLHTEAALLAADAGRGREAEQHLGLARKLVEAQPDAALQRDWLLAAGYYLQGESRFPEALKLFEDAERRGATPEIWLALGSVAEERWTWPSLGGVPPPEAPPIGSPTLTVLQERTGRDRLAREAIAHYEKALRADPRQYEAQLRRGRLLSVLGKTAEAEADLSAVVKSPADPYLKSLAQLFLGRLAEKGPDAGAAVAHYRAALAGRPGFQAAQLALSHALRRAGRPDEAAAAARTALQPRPPGPGGPRVQDLEEPWISYQLGLAWRLPGALAELRRKVQS